jgi:hypothetical protein
MFLPRSRSKPSSGVERAWWRLFDWDFWVVSEAMSIYGASGVTGAVGDQIDVLADAMDQERSVWKDEVEFFLL